MSYARAPSEDRLPVATRRSVPRNDFAHACTTPSRRYFPWPRYRPRPLAVSPAPMSVGCITSVCRITGEPARRCVLLRCRVQKDIPSALGRNFQTPWAYDVCTKNPAENWSLRKKLSCLAPGKDSIRRRRLGDGLSGDCLPLKQEQRRPLTWQTNRRQVLPFSELRNRRTQVGRCRS